MLPPQEWNMSALAALAAAALALPVSFGSSLTAMDAVAVGVLAWVLLGRAIGLTWSDVWRMGASLYRDPLKGGPVLLSNSKAGPGRNFSQPGAHLSVDPCITNYHL